MEPLAGILVVDLTRYIPGPFASRELLRLGARVVRLEAPDGDPLRDTRELRKLTTVYRGGTAYEPQTLLSGVPQSKV